MAILKDGCISLQKLQIKKGVILAKEKFFKVGKERRLFKNDVLINYYKVEGLAELAPFIICAYNDYAVYTVEDYVVRTGRNLAGRGKNDVKIIFS